MRLDAAVWPVRAGDTVAMVGDVPTWTVAGIPRLDEVPDVPDVDYVEVQARIVRRRWIVATRLRPRNGLEQIVAAMVARKVQAIPDEVADIARDNTPGTKTWRPRGDEVVRPQHRKAHGQEVPENLRFVVDSPDYDQPHYGAPPKQQLRHPRDRDATPGLTENCRCQAIEDRPAWPVRSRRTRWRSGARRWSGTSPRSARA